MTRAVPREARARKHPWLYTKKGHLDLSWVLLVVACATMVACLMLEGFHILGFTLPTPAWSCLAGFVGFCFVAGAARDRAEILGKATSPGAVAQAVATALRPPTRVIDVGDADP